MKITIDTKEDSHEEIKKAIQLLTSLLGHVPSNSNDIFSESSSDNSGGNALTSLFGNDSSEETQTLQEEESEEKKDDDAASEVQFIY